MEFLQNRSNGITFSIKIINFRKILILKQKVKSKLNHKRMKTGYFKIKQFI